MDTLELVIPSAVFVVVALLVVAVYQAFLAERAVVRRRMGRYVEREPADTRAVEAADGSVLREHRLSSVTSIDSLLQGRKFAEGMALDLARAAMPLRVDEYLLIRGALALVLGVVGLVIGSNLLPAIALGGLGFFLPKLHVRRSQHGRARQFNDQLVDTISLISNSLKSGYSFLQGIEAVAREMPSPTRDEYGQLLQDLRMGARTEEVLARLAARVRSDDLDMVVTAILIHRSAGGNLSEVLDNIAHTIRERIRIMREVRTLTAQERWSGYIIGALPIFLLVVISMVNPGYTGMLFNTPIGQAMLAGAFLMELVGFWLINRIVSIEV